MYRVFTGTLYNSPQISRWVRSHNFLHILSIIPPHCPGGGAPGVPSTLLTLKKLKKAGPDPNPTFTTALIQNMWGTTCSFYTKDSFVHLHNLICSLLGAFQEQLWLLSWHMLLTCASWSSMLICLFPLVYRVNPWPASRHGALERAWRCSYQIKILLLLNKCNYLTIILQTCIEYEACWCYSPHIQQPQVEIVSLVLGL